jgi:hypothetical protein
MRNMTIVALVLCTLCAVVGADSVDYQRLSVRLNSFTAFAQDSVSVAFGSEGKIEAVWSSRRQNESKPGVIAGCFSLETLAVSAENHLSSGQRAGMDPVVVAGADGTVWRVWQGVSSRDSGDIWAAADGKRMFRVNEFAEGKQSVPVAAVDSNGNLTVAWLSEIPATRQQAVFCRRFNSSGKALSGQFRVGEGLGNEAAPTVAGAADGRFSVAWAAEDETILVRSYGADGKPLRGPVVVASGIEPVAAMSADGRLAVSYVRADASGSYDIFLQQFDEMGRRLGREQRVNSQESGLQNAPAPLYLPDGSLLVAYNILGATSKECSVWAQRFTADGMPDGEAFPITPERVPTAALAQASGKQRIALGPQGEIAVAWSGGWEELGDNSGAFVTILYPRSLAKELKVADGGFVVPPDAAKSTEIPRDNNITLAAMAQEATTHEPPVYNPDWMKSGMRVDYEPWFNAAADFGFNAITDRGAWYPPDPHMSVGPTHIVCMTNGEIAFFKKDGTNTFRDEIEGPGGFWGSVGATGFVFDPETLYDPLSGRHFAMAAEGYAPGNKSYVLIAISDDSDPNGTWYKYRFDTSALAGNLFDSPNIGVDQDVIYVTGDGFGIVANYPVYTFEKAPMLNGNPPGITKSTTLSTSTQSAGIPPVSFGNPPAYYMIEHQEGNGRTGVRLIALKNPLGTISFSTYTLTVPSYSAPGDPVQKGTSVRPETFDARFWSCVYRNNRLWAAHHVNSNPVVSRWYEIDMRGWPDSGQNPVLLQSGEINPGGGVETFFVSISANANNDAAVCFSRSSSAEYISVSRALRSASDAPNTMQPPVVMKDSSVPYSLSRWGDYSGINVDPADDRTFWAHHEYTLGSNQWRTWCGSFAPAQTEEVLAPNAVVVVKGTYNSGDLGSFVSDDDNYYVVGAAYDPTDPAAVINGTLQLDSNASAPRYTSGDLKVIEKCTTTNAVYRVRAYKTDGSFATLADNVRTALTETTLDNPLPNPVSDFIDAANGNRLRAQIRAASANRLAGFFSYSVDLVNWTLTP